MENKFLNSGKDQVFAKKIEKISDFEFNQDVASVFDDMVSRSIPNYHEIHKIIIDLTRRFYETGTVYDFGCSTGTTMLLMADYFRQNDKELPQFVGIDTSRPMLEKAGQKLRSHGLQENVKLLEESITDVEIENAGMAIMNYTLQFLPVEERLDVLKNIYNGLNDNGCFILAEKIICQDEQIDNLLIDLYYDFKRRNGYSEMEIAQKREALENVLRPLTPQQQLRMLEEAGFKKSEMIFRWYNFACYLCIK
ncbi:tRNA (cmo5U34)-methyltransferase [Bacteriovorax sp. BAL6_X]|uniref:carboxy-S-adenosyl-L-methionine synthase CmoA n=1 Tax=Bacteriovorax sp. BAL6_X TaxID=1201290 RepID=UPI000386889B|nr:carboxy-S-adenosyl-L-methionine synthase CmoA [Bacteriovorax sp. BAL6_X]EPZ51911.1 tRNA (cmo5U34)-methyltransferase [Bacteriovorax sp. BAL6_X]